MSHECQHSVSRRSFLGGVGAGAAGVTAAMMGAAPARAEVRADGPVRFALLTDTHVNVQSPGSTVLLERCYASIARRDAAAVLHCGDITDTGLAEQLIRAGEAVPNALRGKVHYAPGNHEVRWDTSAKEDLHHHLGGESYSFDLGPLHVIAYDPTTPLHEPGHYGATGLDWLRRDLDQVASDSTVLLFQHFPMGDEYLYLDDQDQVLAVLAEYGVATIFAGHVHKESVHRFNGITEVTLAAVKNGATWYAAELADDQLTVTRVEVAEDDSETETPVVSIALRAERPTRAEAIESQVTAGGVAWTVTAPEASRVAVASYAQEVYGGSVVPQWVDLEATDGRWQGVLPLTTAVPGGHRARVRTESAAGAWEVTAPYEIRAGAGSPIVTWTRQFGVPLQGGVTAVGSGDAARGVVVAVDGTVTAIDPRDGKSVWTRKLGPLLRRPAVSDRTLFVGSADHTVSAIDVVRGTPRWRADVGAPVCSEPHVVSRHGRMSIVVSAGEDLINLDRGGRELWRVRGRGRSAGRAASDDRSVFTCATDGTAKAHDAATGAERWSFVMREGAPHTVTLYSGWNTKVLATAGVVLIGSVSATWALDAVTGEQRWRLPGSTMYAGPMLINETDVLLITEFGVISRVELATGTVRWTTELGGRVFESGAVIVGEQAVIQSSAGQLIVVDLATGAEQERLQHSLAYTFAPIGLVDDTVIVGDQNGYLKGFRLPG